MATFRSKFRISRKDKKRLKKQLPYLVLENYRQIAYFFSSTNSKEVYNIAKSMFEKS